MGRHKKRQPGVPLDQWNAEQEQREYEQRMATAEAQIAARLTDEEFDPRLTLEVAEKDERSALERRFTAETLVQNSLEHGKKVAALEEELTNSRFVTAGQQRLERNHLGDREVKARLSIFNRPHKPTAEERVAKRQKDATDEALLRTQKAAEKRGTFSLLFPKAAKPSAKTDSTPALKVTERGFKR